MIKGIAHNAYNTADMEKCLHFYCDCMGFKKIFSLERDDGSPWIEYLKICDGQFLELFYANGKSNHNSKEHAGYNHLCLEVDDIHETVEALRAKGVEIVVEPKKGKDLNWQSWISDPDGNRIELMQFDPGCPQLANQ